MRHKCARLFSYFKQFPTYKFTLLSIDEEVETKTCSSVAACTSLLLLRIRNIGKLMRRPPSVLSTAEIKLIDPKKGAADKREEPLLELEQQD